MELEDLDFIAGELTLDEIGRKHFKLAMQITPKIFSDFLVAKKARSTCLSCDSNQLFVPHTVIHPNDPDLEEYDEGDDEIYVTPQANNHIPFRVYAARYEICCQNCGFVSLYEANTVVKWAMDQGEVTGELV